MVVKAAPATPLVMAKPYLLLEIMIIALDTPS